MYSLIVNPVAGSGYAMKVAAMLDELLKKENLPYRIFYPGNREETRAIAERESADREVKAVISVGGDGTSYDVSMGLIHTGKPMGIIPAGTGNDFIKTLGLPKDPQEAMRFILTHEPRPVDIGKLNDRFFLNVCGTGFDVTVLDYAEKEKKKFRGLTPYLIGLLKAIAHFRPVHIKINADGHMMEQDCLICSIANGRWFGGGIPICPEAQPDDAKLDLVVIDPRARWQIPFYLPGLMLGKDLTFKVTHHYLCDHVAIESKGMRLEVDGEILQMDQAELAIQPGKLNLYW